MSAYRKDFDEIKYVSFLIKDDKHLEKYSYSIRREFQKKKHQLKSVILSEKNLIVILCTIKNI